MNIFAVIKDGIVKNTIKASPEIVESLGIDADFFIEITEADPMPSIDWTYDSQLEVFTDPFEITEEVSEPSA